MKRINTIITFIVFVILVVLVYLAAKMTKSQLSKGGDSMVSTFKEKDIVQKRQLIWRYHNQGDKQSTMQTAEEYLKLVPSDIDAWMILAENYLWTNKLTEAERAVKEALKINSRYPWGLRTLASIYRIKAEQSPQLRQEYLSKAQSEIEGALKIAPYDPWVNLEMARLCLAQGKLDKALQAINRALELRPEEESFLDIKERILSETE